MAISSSEGELLMRDPRPTMPPTKQPRCCTSVMRVGGSPASTLPVKRISWSPGVLGLKKWYWLAATRAVLYIRRY